MQTWFQISKETTKKKSNVNATEEATNWAVINLKARRSLSQKKNYRFLFQQNELEIFD